MGAVPEEAEEAGGDKEEVGAARRWRGQGGGRGRGRRGGVEAAGSGVGRGEGKGIEGEGERERGDRLSSNRYIHTNGAPHPGAP